MGRRVALHRRFRGERGPGGIAYSGDDGAAAVSRTGHGVDLLFGGFGEFEAVPATEELHAGQTGQIGGRFAVFAGQDSRNPAVRAGDDADLDAAAVTVGSRKTRGVLEVEFPELFAEAVEQPICECVGGGDGFAGWKQLEQSGAEFRRTSSDGPFPFVPAVANSSVPAASSNVALCFINPVLLIFFVSLV